MKRNVKPIITIGTSSIVLILLSMCLLTFSVLSLSSARADLVLSEKIINRTKSYYLAESAASDILTILDEQLVSCYQNTSNKEEYFSSIQKNISINEGRFALNGQTLSFQVPIQDTQQLSIILNLDYPDTPNQPFYTIQAWKTENTQTWTPDTHQNVYIQTKENSYE